MMNGDVSRRSVLGGAAGLGGAALLRPGRARAADEPIRIGHQCDLTGALAVTGYWRKKAVDAAVKYVNENGGIAGRQIELFTIDTETKVDVGVLRLRELIQSKNVDFVIGSQNGGVALASNPICKETGTLCLSLSRTDEVTGAGGNPFIFRLIVNTGLSATAAGAWVIDNTAKSWTSLYADYVWGASNRDAWHKQVAAKGGTVLAEVPMPVNTSDPLPYISKLSKPADAVFVAVLGPDIPRVLPALRQLGFANKSIMTADTVFGVMDILSLRRQVEGIWGMDTMPWELSDNDTSSARFFRQAVGLDEHGREVETKRSCELGDAWPAWSSIGFIKQNAEGAGWKSKADTPAMIRYAEAHPNYEESKLFPQGDLLIRPQDHQAFFQYYVLRIEDGVIRTKHRVGKEAGMYPPTVDYRT